jgi:ABC-2 type transport system ATP-binding protein
MSLLEVHLLTKSFDARKVVNEVSFSVASGEIFGLLGPNGAGKSTTIMMLAGLLAADSGTIRMDGHDLVPGDRSSRKQMGIVPQDLAIYPNLTARENLRFFGGLYGIRGTRLRERIDTVLEQIGLSDRQSDQTGVYSGGMKRRLNFGIALLHRPKLLILDEPTVGVDPQSRAHLLDCVKSLAGDGTSVIYCSHYMEEVQELCDRVAIVDQGRLVACDYIGHLLGQLSAQLRLEIADASESLCITLKAIHGVLLVRTENNRTFITLQRSSESDCHQLLTTLIGVLTAIRDHGGQLRKVESDEPDLERFFLQMTGSRLRD